MTAAAVEPSSLPTLRWDEANPADLEVDALVVGVLEGTRRARPLAHTDWADTVLGADFAAALTAMGSTGCLEEITRLPCLGTTGQARVLVAVGLGASDRLDPAALRRATGAALRSLRGTLRVGVVLPGDLHPDVLRAAVEGALLGAYSFDGYRAVSPTTAPVEEIVLTGNPNVQENILVRAVADAVSLVRDLVNTPAQDLGPEELAARAQRQAAAVGVDVEVLDEDDLARGGYGGILGVGRGSPHPPKLVRLDWRPADAAARVALVGKGITFDSGGLSLKPTVGMQNMKCDMAGAATVLGTVLTAATLRLPVAVTGWLCLAENMPSGTATRMGDILTMYGGQRVEVMNTDAEGRLVLADGLARAAEERPDFLIDAATLTGAQMQALGNRTAGVMGNDERLVAKVTTAASRADEPMWAMPMPKELRLNLRSNTADFTNVPPGQPRGGGMLTAAHFLAEFVPEGIPWAHIDLAGPAWNREDDHGYTPQGGTGFGVRTLVELLTGLGTCS